MKRKTLFKRLSSAAMALLLSLSALTQGITASAFSSTNKATQEWLNEWSYDFRGSGLPNGYDIETGKSNDTHFTGYWASSVPYFSTSDGSYAYCINFDKLHTNGTTSKQQTLADYVKGAHVPDSMQRQIKEFCIYSYKGKTQYGYSKDTEICASSIMAQAVSARYYDESTTGLSNNETKLINSYYYNGNNASAHHQELVECYKKMKSEMVSHHDVPSGTSKNSKRIPASATYPATYNAKTGKWTATVKLDSTLSQFSVSKPNAVTSQKSGSEIILTADNEKDLKNVVISITKTNGKYVDHIDECSPLILSGGSDVQEMVVSCYEDKDPVKAYLKITTPIGSAHLDKSFTDYFDNKQTGTADMYKAVKFQLVRKVGDSYKFVKATGKDGSYSFTDLASQATDLTPNGKGDIDVTGLPEGDYEWREISTADGYMISSKKAITVTADKTAKTEFINKASAPDKGKITIHKRDAETRADLAGAKFEVAAAEDIYVGNGYCIYPKGTVIDTITTGADGIAETTKAIYKGYSYTVTEIEAPKGYSISDEPTQTIKLVEQQAEFVVDFDNKQNTIPFEITKTDISTGELIPDCTFEILNENKEQVITGTTDENGQKIADEEADYTGTYRDIQWKNKTITELYYPGSVFKVITAAMGVDSGKATYYTTLNCSGAYSVAKQTYHCAGRKVHGAQNLAEALRNSCNIYFVQLGQRVGSSLFYDYFDAFGFTERTGVDLPNETSFMQYYSKSRLGEVELASSAFGQAMAVTPLQVCTAISAAVNGGYLVTPHVVDKITDQNGNVVQEIGTNTRRQVISESTSETIRQIMEFEVGDGTQGGGGNAYVAGYRIGGKSGTSEQLNMDRRADGDYKKVASFAAVLPANDPEILVYVMLDDPNNARTDYSSILAAPVVGNIISEIAPYLGIATDGVDRSGTTVKVPNLTGKEWSNAQVQLNIKGLKHHLAESESDQTAALVTYQYPRAGAEVPYGTTIYLYTDTYEGKHAEVPDVTGKSADFARQMLNAAGLNCTVEGSGTVQSQSEAPGSSVQQGTIVHLICG